MSSSVASERASSSRASCGSSSIFVRPSAPTLTALARATAAIAAVAASSRRGGAQRRPNRNGFSTRRSVRGGQDQPDQRGGQQVHRGGVVDYGNREDDQRPMPQIPGIGDPPDPLKSPPGEHKGRSDRDTGTAREHENRPDHGE